MTMFRCILKWLDKLVFTQLVCYAVIVSSLSGCQASAQTNKQEIAMTEAEINQKGYEVITLGGGCFWCIEAAYIRIDGVKSAQSGYMGGEDSTANYYAVSKGNTNHAEVVQVIYDPQMIATEDILDWFWRMHDPTTLNKQGPDVGTQYRSVIFYHSKAQAEIAEASEKKAAANFDDSIVTEIQPAMTFHPAEISHQDYYEKHPDAAYCQMIITPKLKKLNLE